MVEFEPMRSINLGRVQQVCRHSSLLMGIISWSAVNDVLSKLVLLLKPCFCNPRLKRRFSFGVDNGSDQGTSPLPSQSESLPERRTIAELAIPAGLCVALYGSIPPDVQQNHGALFLYDPLVALICLGVFASLFAVVYALANSAGGAAVESTKNMAMALSLVFLLVAFVFRILLLLSGTSMELVGLVLLFSGAAAAAAVLCFRRLTVEERIAPAAAEAAQNHSFCVENQV